MPKMIEAMLHDGGAKGEQTLIRFAGTQLNHYMLSHHPRTTF
jgi:hypothetical protein